MRKIHRLDLDFAKDIRTQRKITFKEQDSITLYMSIYNDGVPVILNNQTPRLFIKKSDGTILYQTEVLEIQNNVVAFDVHRQATTCPGLCYAEVEFIEDEELITTRSFVYIVEPKVGSIKDAIASVDEAYFLKVVEDFITQAKLDIAEYKETVANIEAQVEEANNRLEQLDKDLKDANVALDEAKNNALEEITQTKDDSIDEISQAKEDALEEIEISKDESLEEIETLKDNSIEELTEYSDNINKAITMLKNSTVIEITDLKKSSLKEMKDTRDEALEQITELRDNSLSEIGQLRDDSLNDITGLTNESKEAIEALRKEVIDNIDDYTIEHIEELEIIIENLIPTVGEAKELETSLINLQENLTILKDTLQRLNGDGYLLSEKLESNINTSKTVLNDLSTSKNEAISIKVALNQVIASTESLRDALIVENERAEANIAELNELHPQADIRIIELRDLIQQAIDIAIPALRAYIAEHTPAEDLTEVNERLEALTNAINETYSILINHHHDTLYGASKKQNYFGDNIFLFEKESYMTTHEPPEWIADYKSCMQFSTFKSSNTEYYSIYFKDDLNDADCEVYMSLDGATLTIHNGVLNQNYYAMRGTGTGGGQTGLTSFTLLGTSKVYTLDFPLWDVNKESIVIQSPKTSGLNNFDSANIAGYYTIDLPLSTFQQMANAPSIIANKDIKGILEVKQVGANVMQTLTIHSLGQTYTRLIGQSWERTDGGVSNENVMTIGVSQGETLPEGIESMPKNPYFWEKNVGYVVFQANPTLLYVVYTYGTELTAYYPGGSTFYINHAQSKAQGFKYSSGKWSSSLSGISGSNIGGVSVVKANFRVLACSHPVYTSSSYDTVYCDTKAIDYSVLPTLQNFRDIPRTGKYYVDINEGDDIAYAPYTETEQLVVALNDEELSFDSNDDGLLEPCDLERMPQTIPVDDVSYRTMPRAITTRAIKGYVDAVVKNSNEKHLTFYGDDGDVLKMTYNASGWTGWKSIGGQEINLDDFYTKEETDELISNVEVDLSGYATKEELQEAIETIDISDYATKEELEEAVSNIKVSSEIGLIQDGAQTEFEELPTTFSGYPENPDASQYPFELKVTHYGYHMVFYFPENPSMKVGVVRRTDGKLGFKLIDSSFSYTEYKGYYRKSTSSSGSWTAFSNNNHFINPDSRELTNIYYHNFDLLNANNPSEVMFYGEAGSVEGAISDFNKATEYDKYNVISATGEIANSPIEGSFKGVLNVSNVNSVISQELHTTTNKTYKRVYNGTWTEWEEDAKKADLDSLNNIVGDLAMPIPDKVQTITYTNSDGMPEVYSWIDINGFKIMWINVKHSETEYNSGTTGLMMKTLNFPAEAQIFNNIIMANITSYCRSTNNTLSRIVQNAEIISNVSVRGRWRHTDNIPPSIDNFTIMCFGF